MMKIDKTYIVLFSLLLLILGCCLPAYSAEKAQYVVVIDAGHGGHDTGAVDNGFKEKDLNLAVALKVGDLVKKNLKNVKVVYTRSNDTFISLQERANKANQAKADLFISIHTNSVAESNPNRTTVAGSSVYTLGTDKDDKNMAVAQRENSVIKLEKDSKEKYSGFDPNSIESYIIFEMAQKKNLSQSIKFAKEVQTRLVNDAHRGDRGVHQAGFWVLWATSMPSVLVEMDFICNPNSAKYLGSKQGQDQIAEAIAKAIEKYFKNPTAFQPKEDDETEAVTEVYAYSSGKADGSNIRRAEFLRSTGQQNPSISEDRQKAQKKNIPQGKRRRRNIAAEKESNNRIVAVDNMTLHPQIHVSQAGSDVAVKEVAQKTQKPEKKEEKESKKKKENKRKHAQRERAVTIWTIELLVSDSQLSSKNPVFCGLSPISMTKENNLYKYYYGESEDKSEMETLLNTVRQNIPDAKLVKTTKMMKSSKK